MQALRVLLLLLCFVSAGAVADEIEVITLHHRTVEQMIPALQPLLDAGGAITGSNGALVVRSSRRNIEDLKRVAAALDVPPRRLLISVRQDVAGGGDERDLQASGTLVGRRGSVSVGESARPASGAALRSLDSSAARDERNLSRVQALEGSPAWIAVGQSIAVPTETVRHTPWGSERTRSVEYRDLNTGFSVVPHLNGEQVTLDIAPQRDVPGAYGPGSADTQHIVTHVSARLGEWFELGSVTQGGVQNDARTLSSRARGEHELRRVWVRVDEIK